MEGIVFTVIVIVVMWWIYRAGKREGSVKAYGVSRRHERQRRRW